MSRPSATAPPVPTLLTLLLCDQVITESHSNKKSLIGVFDRMWVAELPAIHLSPVWIFARLVDAVGDYIFRVEIVKLESDEPILRIVTPSTAIVDPLSSTDIALKLPGLPVGELGTYEFQLYANDVWIGRTKMIIQRRGATTS